MKEHQQIDRKQKGQEKEQRQRVNAHKPMYDQLKTHDDGTITGVDFSFDSPPDRHAELLAEISSHTQRADFLMQLQQNYGNRYVQRLIEPRSVQAKLAVGTPGDIYEQEADQIADRVMRMPKPVIQKKPNRPFAKFTSCGGETETLQKKEPPRQANAVGNHSIEVPSIVHEVLSSPGQPLDHSIRAIMESGFRCDFSQVHVHANAKSAESAQAVNALAYAVGSDIVFGAGQYRPDSTKGRQLLAHELAHVLQQQPGLAGSAPITMNDATDNRAVETEADLAASALVENRHASISHSYPISIQRHAEPGGFSEF